MIDKSKLKELALAAKDWTAPEAWEEDRHYSKEEIAGLEFNAAANPAAILELLAELDAVQEETRRAAMNEAANLAASMGNPHDRFDIAAAIRALATTSTEPAQTKASASPVPSAQGGNTCEECHGSGLREVSEFATAPCYGCTPTAPSASSSPAAPVAGSQQVPVELAGVSAELKEGSGFWNTCSGCHESEDGHDNGPYPYSDILNCKLGMGCSECGGIGAIWDNADYEAMGADFAAAAPAVPVPAAEQFDFHAHLARQAAFSLKTFGPGMRTKGVCDHIRKELIEVESDPADLREWVDVVILALDGAWRCGGSPEQIIAGIVAKQTKNEGRNWPDWRTADPEKAIEHDRSGEAAPSLQQPKEGGA